MCFERNAFGGHLKKRYAGLGQCIYLSFSLTDAVLLVQFYFICVIHFFRLFDVLDRFHKSGHNNRMNPASRRRQQDLRVSTNGNPDQYFFLKP